MVKSLKQLVLNACSKIQTMIHGMSACLMRSVALIKTDFWYARKVVVIIFSLFVVLPVSICKTDWSSLYGIISFCILVIVVLVLNISNWLLLEEDNAETKRDTQPHKHHILHILRNKICRNSRNEKSRWYKILYRGSTEITGVIILVALWPILAKRIGLQGTWLSNYRINAPIALSWGLLYSIDFLFYQFRWTYRVLPSALLSFSLLIMYVIILCTPFGQYAILNLGVMDPERIAVFITDTFTKWLGWGLLGTIATTLISKATEEVWYGMSRSATGDYAKINYRFKLQRRKLLTYQGKRITRVGKILLVYMGIISFAGICLFFSKAGNIRRFLGQGYFVGTAMAIMGFLLHQFITDEHLLRSENDYIEDRRQAAVDSWGCNKALPCGGAEWQWTSYCQVLTNIFCSRSPIYYENEVNHKDGLLALALGEQQEKVCPVRLIADLAGMFEEHFSLYCKEEAETEKYKIELQFAESINRYIQNILSAEEMPGWDQSTFVFKVIKQISDVYFSVASDALNIEGVPFDDVRKLLMYDYLRAIISEQGEDFVTQRKCRISWWCNSNESEKQAEVLRQIYPYKVLGLLIDRWGKEKLISSGLLGINNEFTVAVNEYEKYWNNENSVWADISDEATESIDCLKNAWHSKWDDSQ